MRKAPMQMHQPGQDEWSTYRFDQPLEWRQNPNVIPIMRTEPQSTAQLEPQCNQANQFVIGGQPRREYQYLQDPRMNFWSHLQGPSPNFMPYNAWSPDNGPSNCSGNVYPYMQSRDFSFSPFSQVPMTHMDVGTGYAVPGQESPYVHGPHGYTQEPLLPPGDLRQGNSTAFLNHVEGHNPPSDGHGSTPLFIPTPSPGNSGHGSPRSPRSLYEDAIGSYMDQDEPWKPLRAHRSEHGSIQDTQGRDRSYYPHVTRNGIVILHYPVPSEPKPGPEQGQRLGQKTSPQVKGTKKRYPGPKQKLAIPDRRRSHPARKPSHEDRNPIPGLSQTFDLNMRPKHKRRRRCFSDGEKARMKAVREARACTPCHEGHRKCDHKVPPSTPSPAAAPSEEPSPISSSDADPITDPITPAPAAGQGQDFILFESSQGSGTDEAIEAMDLRIDLRDAYEPITEQLG